MRLLILFCFIFCLNACSSTSKISNREKFKVVTIHAEYIKSYDTYVFHYPQNGELLKISYKRIYNLGYRLSLFTIKNTTDSIHLINKYVLNQFPNNNKTQFPNNHKNYDFSTFHYRKNNIEDNFEDILKSKFGDTTSTQIVKEEFLTYKQIKKMFKAMRQINSTTHLP